MLSFDLAPHPGLPAPAGLAVGVEASCPTARLVRLAFRLTGTVANVVWPAAAGAHRRDGLWTTTCLEAFFGHPDRSGYFELNMSPSLAWAAYALSHYRAPLEPANWPEPVVEIAVGPHLLSLTATLPVEVLRGFSHIAPAAVIETKDGQKSYWAAVHPKDTPDFHTLAGMARLPDPMEQA
jgi:hypothetical protein